MKRKFIICTHESSVESQSKFRDKLDKLGLNWWHWLPGTWLVIDDIGNTSVSSLRDEIINIMGLNTVVFEVNPRSWAGYGPSSEDPQKSMFHWIKNYWDK